MVNLIPDFPRNKEILEGAAKLVLLQPEVTWLVHGIKSIRHNVYTCTGEINTFHELEDMRGIVKASPDWDLKDWIPQQEAAVKKFPSTYSPDKIWRRPKDGFLL